MRAGTLAQLAALSAVVLGCSAGSRKDADDSPAEERVVAIAVTGSMAEGVLSGKPDSAEASLMTLGEAQAVLEDWGAVFAEFPDYPALDTPAWLVDLLGEGVAPGPPAPGEVNGDNRPECLEIRVIVLDGADSEFVIFGKPSGEC